MKCYDGALCAGVGEWWMRKVTVTLCNLKQHSDFAKYSGNFCVKECM